MSESFEQDGRFFQNENQNLSHRHKRSGRRKKKHGHRKGRRHGRHTHHHKGHPHKITPLAMSGLAQNNPNGKLRETVMPDGNKVYEFIEDPGQIPMKGVDPVIEKHVKLSQTQRPQIIHLH